MVYKIINYKYTCFSDFVFQEETLGIQQLPFNTNSSHFELFKPELFLLQNTIIIAFLIIYTNKYYRPKDITYFSYILTFFVLEFTLLFYLKSLNIFTNSTVIFNLALVIDDYTQIIKITILVASLAI
jgi:hypothetical protein